VVDPAGHAGAWNMAVDEALLVDAARTGRSTLRLYRWSPSCLSFGRNEPARSRYDRRAIERLGLDVVRRPTGGRAVWHDAEVTYAVAAPVAAFGTLAESYRAIHERLAAALRALGARAELAPSRPASGVGAGPCFATPVGGEVLVEGRKVIGSAQVRRGTAFLQHGSILLDGSQDFINAVSRQPLALGTDCSLSAVLGRVVQFEEVAEAILETWGEPLAPSGQAPIHPSTFSDPDWTWRR
jgi:lipoate-protein ligase A